MYVIVVGGGTVGYYMSRDLLERGHEVTLIERDQRRADWLETQLGSIVMRGDGCEVKFLSQTGIERADAIVAVTADDEDNLIALQMAKRHFNVKKTIARVNNPSNVEIFKKYPSKLSPSLIIEICSGAGPAHSRGASGPRSTPIQPEFSRDCLWGSI